ncbi:MAG: L-histidine N(alpha)-methyltransferase [Candidatus Nitrosotenuis sp.]|nr:MAG: L-histidine N(alpha)-methyltransferase [Candidatus Nitrosotenuis sp.]
MTSFSNAYQYVTTCVGPNCVLLKSLDKKRDEFASDIAYGLTRKKKFIPSKYFYDINGSQLFEQICNLPEYYLTRKEIEILSSIKNDLARYLSTHAVIELGSGSATKTRFLFEILSESQDEIQYFPIDISDIIHESTEKLQDEFSNLKITGIVDQYEGGLKLLKSLRDKKIIVFFGSSFGNFDKKNGTEFLKRIRESMNAEDLFLLGIDLVKDIKVLEQAYDDPQGITKKFNLNVLARINRELGANFNPSNFDHVAFYNSAHKRIEMHLQAKTDQHILIKDIDLSVKLRGGEKIRTEYSHKYTIPQLRSLAEKTGFKIKTIWSDQQKYFGLVLLSIK